MGVLESRRCCPVPLARDTLKVSYAQSYNCLLVMLVQFNGMVRSSSHHTAPAIINQHLFYGRVKPSTPLRRLHTTSESVR